MIYCYFKSLTCSDEENYINPMVKSFQDDIDFDDKVTSRNVNRPPPSSDDEDFVAGASRSQKQQQQNSTIRSAELTSKKQNIIVNSTESANNRSIVQQIEAVSSVSALVNNHISDKDVTRSNEATSKSVVTNVNSADGFVNDTDRRTMPSQSKVPNSMVDSKTGAQGDNITNKLKNERRQRKELSDDSDSDAETTIVHHVALVEDDPEKDDDVRAFSTSKEIKVTAVYK